MASGLPDHIARPLRSGKWICPLFLFLSMAGYLTVMESTLRFESPRYFENRTARAVFEALLNDRSLYIQKGDIKVIDNTDVLNLFYTPQEVRALRGFVDRLNSQEPAFSISARDGVLSLQGVGQGDGASGLIRLVEEGLNKNIVYMERGEFCRLDEAAEKAIGAKINNDDIVRLILNEAKRERSSIRMTAAFNAAQGLAELKLAGNPFTIALAKPAVPLAISYFKNNLTPSLERIDDGEMIVLQEAGAKSWRQDGLAWHPEAELELIQDSRDRESCRFFVHAPDGLSLNGRPIPPNVLAKIKNGDIISAGFSYILRNSNRLVRDSSINGRRSSTSLLGESGNNLLGISSDKYLRGVFAGFFQKEAHEIVLTLHPDLQRELYRLLVETTREQSSVMRAGIVVQDQRGRLLGLVGYPSFNDADSLQELEDLRWERNFSLDPVPPGSRVKPELAQAAYGTTNPAGALLFFNVQCQGITNSLLSNASLGQNRIDLDIKLPTSFQCAGRVAHGDVDIRNFLAKSCDIYSANLLSYLYDMHFRSYTEGQKPFSESLFAVEMDRAFDYASKKEGPNAQRNFLFVPEDKIILTTRTGEVLPSSAGIVRLLAGRGHISEAKLNSYFPFYKGYLALDRLGRKDYRTVASISIGGDEVRVPLLIMNNNMIRLFTGVKVYPQLIHSLVDEGGEAILNQAADQLYEDRNSTTMVKLGLSDAANREYGTLYQPTRDFRQRMASYFRCAGKTGTHEDIAHDFIGTCATLFIEPEADARKIDPDITGIAVSVYLQSNRASIHAKELLQDILRILLNTYYPTLGPMLTPGPL